MSHRNITGFETGTLGELHTTSGTIAVQSTTVRNGTYALRANPSGAATGYGYLSGHTAAGVMAALAITGGNVAYGMAHVRFGALPSSAEPVLSWRCDTTHYELRVDGSGNLAFYADTSLVANLSGAVATGQWYRLECKLQQGTNGAWEWRLDGVTIGSGTIASVPQIDYWVLGKHANRASAGIDCYYDDVAIRDDDWPGGIYISILKPDGNGFYTAWTGTYTDVDEIPPDGDTSYIESSSNAAETVTLDDAATGGVGPTIRTVKAVLICRWVSSITAGVGIRMRVNTTDVISSSSTPPSAYGPAIAILRDVNPEDSAAWDATALDALQIGVHNLGSKAIRVTAMYAMVASLSPAAPSVVDGPTVAYVEGGSTHSRSTPFTVTFTAEDDTSQGANEITYAIYTGASRTGTLVATGTCTHGVEKVVPIAYDATGLVDGSQTLYLSVDDGDLTSDDESFAVVRQLGVAGELDLRWRVGGRVSGELDMRWRVGGRVSGRASLLWRVAPSPNRVSWALDGRRGNVIYAFRYERRTVANQYIDNVTPAITAASGDLNNDRAILRTARFAIDAAARDDRGNAITIDPLADHVAVVFELLVDGSYWLDIPMGLFALAAPRRTYTPADEVWQVDASDLTIHLLESTTAATYSVAAGENYLRGSGAVADILDALGLRHALPPTAKTLPVARSWPAGTPWLAVVNELLQGCGMYTLWFDREGVAKSRVSDELAGRSPDVVYDGAHFLEPLITQEDDTNRFANQIVAVVDDPNRPPLSAVATNDDPDSPISTIRLGRTITKVIAANSAADQDTIDAAARRALEQAASLYQRGQIRTPIDPRRDAHEVYQLDVEGVYEASVWWCRNWSVDFSTGASMKHALGRVQRVAG